MIERDKSKDSGISWAETTHSIGPRILSPRTCVSFPFMWLLTMMTCNMYASTYLLLEPELPVPSYVTDSERTHKPSPSSFGSKQTSNVIHPSGFSIDRMRISCRSIIPVPARTAIVAGVYESSRGKLRYIDIFCGTQVSKQNRGTSIQCRTAYLDGDLTLELDIDRMGLGSVRAGAPV